MARLQNEVGTNYFFRGAYFPPPPKKNAPKSFTQNSRQISPPNFSPKNQKKSPTRQERRENSELYHLLAVPLGHPIRQRFLRRPPPMFFDQRIEISPAIYTAEKPENPKSLKKVSREEFGTPRPRTPKKSQKSPKSQEKV